MAGARFKAARRDRALRVIIEQLEERTLLSGGRQSNLLLDADRTTFQRPSGSWLASRELFLAARRSPRPPKPIPITLRLVRSPGEDGVAVIQGKVPARANVKLDVGADGTTEKVARADRKGSFLFGFPVDYGTTIVQVLGPNMGRRPRIGHLAIQRPDSISPIIGVESPGAGALFNSNFTVKGHAFDRETGVQTLMVGLDGEGLSTLGFDATGGFVYATSLPLGGTGDGDHEVHFRAIDRAGNSSVSAFHFTLDSVPPAITQIAPAAGSTVAASPTIAGIATDALSGLATLQASIDGQPFLNVPYNASGHFSIPTAFPADGSADGPHSVVVRAADRAGNVSLPSRFTFDLDSPIRVAPVGPLSVMPGHQLTVPLSATSPDGSPVTFSLRSSSALPNGTLIGNTLTFSPNVDQIGAYRFTIVARDGRRESTQDVSLVVSTDPVTTTRISGSVLGTDGQPLANLPIELGRFQTTTDANGHFLLELPASAQLTSDFDISIPQGDVHFDPSGTGSQTITLFRAVFDPSTGTSIQNPRKQVNQVSSFLDASVVYGSDATRAAALRAMDGTGHLKTSPGDLLPLNNATYFPDGPLPNDNEAISPASGLYVAGDVRASENTQLAALHTLLVREHNRLADGYHAAHPSWNDEQIYQAARRIVGAILQSITYNEFIPALLGPDGLPAYTGYDRSADPRISTMFSTVAFRVGHTLLTPDVPRIGADGQPLPGGALSLRDAFFNVQPIAEDGIDPFLRGMVGERAENVDNQVIDEVRNFLFGPPGSGGMDLPSMNIQRGRDEGLPDYNAARVDFGLPPVTSFSQITSDPALQDALRTSYGSVDNIDPWVGGVSEDHLPGAAVGPFFAAVMKDQFTRTRDGDRFWYENGQFSDDELALIRSTTLASLIEQNTGITGLPTNVFTQGTANPSPSPAGMSGTTADTRTYDGSGNDLQAPGLGQAGSHLLRNFTNGYADGISEPSGGDRPNPRSISNAINARTSVVPNAEGLTMMAVLWGQLLDHDLSLTPSGVTNTLKFHGDMLQGGAPRPFVAEKLPLLLGHSPQSGVENVIARPVYLPILNPGTAIDPDASTTVSQVLTPGEAAAQVQVAAGTLQTRSGQLYSGTLSISEVPPDFTPAALPANLSPDLVVTIQPAEMVFTTPAPLSLPNRAGWAPGTKMRLWSINPVTGVFDDVGEGMVSADGTMIDTVSGGIRNSSWHFFSCDVPSPGDPSLDHPYCDSCQPTALANSVVNLHTGAIEEDHALVAYQSLGQVRGLTLHYDSGRAYSTPIVKFGYADVNPNIFSVPSALYLVAALAVEIDGVKVQVPGFASPGEYGLAGGEHFWTIPAGGGPLDAAIQADLHDQPTGVYSFDLIQGLRGFTGTRFIGTSANLTGPLINVNLSVSTLGSGWSLAGVTQLVEGPDGTVLLVDGDGSELLYSAGRTAGTYLSPPGDFSTLRRFAGGFRRTLTGGTVEAYDSGGRLVSVTDRNGNATQYAYDAAGNLKSITDPVGLQTTFTYANGRVVLITDPAGRQTTLSYDLAGNLRQIVDPDGATTTYVYDASHRLTSSTDPRGNAGYDFYDEFGRATHSILYDGSTVSYTVGQTHALYRSLQTSDPTQLLPPAFRAGVMGDATYTDGNGHTVTYRLDSMGQVVSQSDAIGEGPSVQRDHQNLVVSSTDGNGSTTQYVHDGRGNVTRAILPGPAVIQTTDVIPYLSDGYRYQVVGTDVGAGFEQPGFDDSAFSAGAGGFGTLFGGDLNNPANVKTPWAGSSDILLRRTFELPEDTTAVTIGVAIDNDIAIFINGHDISGGMRPHEGRAARDNLTFDVPLSDLVPGSNLLAIRARDRGAPAYVDIRLTATIDHSDSYHYEYDPIFSKLTRMIDPLGHQTLFDVDPADGNIRSMTSVVGPPGGDDDLITTYTYASHGLIATETDPLGRVTEYGYDPLGQLLFVTFARGTPDEATRHYEYDSAGNQTAVIDENGNRTGYLYDPINRLTQVTQPDPDGAGPLTSPVTTYAYDKAGNQVLQIDALGHVTRYDYDPMDRLTQTIDANGGTTIRRYDAAGNLTSFTDPLGHETITRYDARDRSIATIDPIGSMTRFGYDLTNNLTSVTDPVGNITTYAYDDRNRQIRETSPTGSEIRYAYDAADNLVGRQVFAAVPATIAYSGFGDLGGLQLNGSAAPINQSPVVVGGQAVLRLTNGGGQSSSAFSTQPLAFGMVDADPSFHSTFSFQITNSGGISDGDGPGADGFTFLMSTAPDKRGGNGASIGYGGLTPSLAVEFDTYNNGGVDQHSGNHVGIDVNGNLASVALAPVAERLNNDAVWYAWVDYDGATLEVRISQTNSRPDQAILAAPIDLKAIFAGADAVYAGFTSGTASAYGNHDIRSWSMTYNVLQAGRRTEYAYDDVDRLETETWIEPDGTTVANTIHYAYDNAGNLISAADGFSSLAYTYDDRDRVKTVDNAGTLHAPHVVLTYEYDAVGNQLSVSDTIDGQPGGINSFTYDPLNRQTRIVQRGSGVQDKRVDFTYNPLGQFSSIARYADLGGSQLVAPSSYDYDPLNRLKQLTHAGPTGTLASYGLSYDNASRITQIIDVDGISTYDYDKSDQLIGADHTSPPKPDETYSYDANGNRTMAGYSTGTNNQLLSDGTYTYKYDAEGNLSRRTTIADGATRDFVWDFRNRLVSVIDKDTARDQMQRVEYNYDVLDRRTSESVQTAGSTTTRTFVYDSANVALEFQAASGTPTPFLLERNLFGPGIDQILAQDGGSGTVSWLLADYLGTVRDVVGNTGNVTNHLDYDSFGSLVSQTNQAATPRYQFTGRELDAATGLQFNRARYYDSVTGRFISRDPLSFRARDTNLYRYVRQQPLRFKDPQGLALGDLPPPPPGYDPKTWPSGFQPNSGSGGSGRWWLQNPENGNTYYSHPEDETHWRHWDIEDPNGNDLGRCPEKSIKLWRTQKRPPYGDQSTSDPSGDATPWSSPKPRIPWWRTVPEFFKRHPIIVVNPCLIDPAFCNQSGVY